MYKKMVCNGMFYTETWYEKRLANMPYASAGIITGKNPAVTMLKSYCTFVLCLDQNGWLQCTGIYSRTTIRHISAFLKEYAPGINYYDVKKIAGKGIAINIHTRETMECTGMPDIYGFYTMVA